MNNICIKAIRWYDSCHQTNIRCGICNSNDGCAFEVSAKCVICKVNRHSYNNFVRDRVAVKEYYAVYGGLLLYSFRAHSDLKRTGLPVTWLFR